jgi:hypothetical protein
MNMSQTWNPDLNYSQNVERYWETDCSGGAYSSSHSSECNSLTDFYGGYENYSGVDWSKAPLAIPQLAAAFIPALGEEESAGSAVGDESGIVIRNAMSPKETLQANDLMDYSGGKGFIGQSKDNTPGIDGWMNGDPVSLKEYTGSSPAGILRHVSKAEDQARKAGYSDVTVYVDARNVSVAQINDFAHKGPLVRSIFKAAMDGYTV